MLLMDPVNHSISIIAQLLQKCILENQDIYICNAVNVLYIIDMMTEM